MRQFIIFALLVFISCKNSKTEEIKSTLTGDPILDQMTTDMMRNPDDPNTYYTRAKYLYDQEFYDEAIRDMAQAMKRDSTTIEYYHLLSDIYMDYYQSDKALNVMYKASLLEPERIPTLLKLSETQFILKRYEPSVKTLNNILKYDPQNAEAYFMLGLNFKEGGDIPRAINSFQTAIDFDPELIDGWLELGNILESQKDLRAIDYYNGAVNVAPQNISALHSKAYFLQNHQKETEAIEIYNQINKIDREYKDAYLNKGILFLEAENLERAYEEFNILCNLHPTYHLGFYYRGIVNELNNNTDAARADYQNAVNLKSDFKKGVDALSAIKELQ